MKRRQRKWVSEARMARRPWPFRRASTRVLSQDEAIQGLRVAIERARAGSARFAATMARLNAAMARLDTRMARLKEAGERLQQAAELIFSRRTREQ